MLELYYLPAHDSSSILLESDDGMAITDGQFNDLKNNVSTLKTDVKGLKDDVNTLKIDVGSIKTDISEFKGSLKVIKGIAVCAAVPVLAWATFITYNVIAMMNGGGSKIVAELEAPKSPEQLQANLSTVIAQLQTAKVKGIKPDEKKVKALSGALSQVVEHNQNLPEAWSATAELISYQSQILHPIPEHLPACNLNGLKPETRPTRTPTGALDYNPGFYLSNCALRLEDVTPLTVTEVPSDFGIKFINPDHRNRVGFPIYLSNGEVIYNGGPIQTKQGFVFVNCVFNLHTRGVPDAPAQDLLMAALKSDDLSQVKIAQTTQS